MQRPKILIVDDEKDVREAFKNHLARRIECGLSIAANGDEVLSLLKEASFDLVLLDIRMPGLSGMDMIKQLRKNNPRMYILIISGLDNEDVIQQAIKEGADDFLCKPVSLKALDLKIATALSKIGKYYTLIS